MGNTGMTRVKEVAEFRRLQSQSNIEIPEIPENRRPTDRYFLFVFIGFIIMVIIGLGYTLAFSDIRRLQLYDPCGNLCGYQNNPWTDISCSGKDNTANPYLKFERRRLNNVTYEQLLLEPRSCVSNCGPSYEPIGHFCVPTKSSNDQYYSRTTDDDVDFGTFLQKVASDLGKVWWRIVVALLMTAGVTALMLVIFRYALAPFVWGTMITIVVLLVIGTGLSWFAYVKATKDTDQQTFLMGGIVMSIVTVTTICLFAFMAKKIALVIMILKEATKAIFAMPQLTLIPILFFFIKAIIFIGFLVTTIFFFTSGKLRPLKDSFYSYQPDAGMLFTEGINLVIFIWSTQFVVGIQYMIVSGAVSHWYFAKNKNYLDGPVGKSISNTFKYHLGTVAFGSLIITLVILVKMLIRSMLKNKWGRLIVECILSAIEDLIKFLSKNAYIITAMHGKGFWRSGKRATKLIVQNIVNIVAINYVGDFVLGMAQFLIVLVSILLSFLAFLNADTETIFIPYLMVAGFAIILATSIFAPFETAVDTIFICFCEDMLMNDGMAKPYAMSKGLMDFIEKSKTVLKEKEIPQTN